MSKVIITITDIQDEDKNLNLHVNFGDGGANHKSPAHLLALIMLKDAKENHIERVEEND